MGKRLLLISNSRQYGVDGYLEWCKKEISDFLGPEIKKVLFIPYAATPESVSYSQFTEEVRPVFENGALGRDLTSIHEVKNPKEAVEGAQAIFVGGGNTYVLLRELYRLDILDDIRRRVIDGGAPYIGVSAGANIVCPTIMTTNDWKIVKDVPDYALGLVPFQINPHFVISENNPTFMGGTREQKIKSFLSYNDVPVIGLSEGSMLLVENDKITVLGLSPVRLYERGKFAVEYPPGTSLNFLLQGRT